MFLSSWLHVPIIPHLQYEFYKPYSDITRDDHLHHICALYNEARPPTPKIHICYMKYDLH